MTKSQWIAALGASHWAFSSRREYTRGQSEKSPRNFLEQPISHLAAQPGSEGDLISWGHESDRRIGRK
jgi:hypothetical protein